MEKTGSAMTKPQESMHRKIFPNENRKKRLLENKFQQKLKNPNSGYGQNFIAARLQRENSQKTNKKTRSISPFTIVIKGVREFFREKFHDKPPTPEAELVTKNPSRRKAKTVEL